MDVIECLEQTAPRFHGSDENPRNWRLGAFGVNWMKSNLKADWHCLETGAGYTTCVMAQYCKSVITISPLDKEHMRIKSWLVENGFSHENIKFIHDLPQKYLPFLKNIHVDLLLIDGGHAFPYPIIDWYYGSMFFIFFGYLLVDNIEINSVRILYDFLLTESDVWALQDRDEEFSVFQKKKDFSYERVKWIDQVFNK